jgi:hypothetical protein
VCRGSLRAAFWEGCTYVKSGRIEDVMLVVVWCGGGGKSKFGVRGKGDRVVDLIQCRLHNVRWLLELAGQSHNEFGVVIVIQSHVNREAGQMGRHSSDGHPYA